MVKAFPGCGTQPLQKDRKKHCAEKNQFILQLDSFETCSEKLRFRSPLHRCKSQSFSFMKSEVVGSYLMISLTKLTHYLMS